MKKFKRRFCKTNTDTELIKAVKELKETAAFQWLLADVEQGDVFPALRGDTCLDFYCYGQKLCRYKPGSNKSDRYTWFENVKSPQTEDDYAAIRERCRKKGGVTERAQLAGRFYKTVSPYCKENADRNVILLDIEVGFPVPDDKMIATSGLDKAYFNNTQIDCLLLDTASLMLFFVEAKRTDNRAVRIKTGGLTGEELYSALDIGKQLKKYEVNMASQETDIVDAYKDYIEIMNRIFDTKLLREPLEDLALHKQPILFVFGPVSTNAKDKKICLDTLKEKLGNHYIQKECAEDFTDGDIPR